jgi:hypothetical protein
MTNWRFGAQAKTSATLLLFGRTLLDDAGRALPDHTGLGSVHWLPELLIP